MSTVDTSPSKRPTPDAQSGDDPSAEARSVGALLAELDYWVVAAGILTILFVGVWTAALAPLGDASLYAHIFGVPMVGGLTLPVALWGIMRTVFRPPVFRISRLVGFGLLLLIGFFGNVPMFAAPVGTADWESEHRYRLPFEGTWRTLAGGPAVARNYHATTAAFRWAYDFAPVREGARFRGEGDELADYYCWGEPVLASASGEVVKFEDERKDFPPQEFDESSVYGNHVILRVADEEYLYIAHLQRGSVPVRPGDEVDRGDRVGRCGNSGRAFEPHVHVHLQDRIGFPVAQSLPLRFSNYRVEGSGRVERGMPRGQVEGGDPPGESVEYVGE